jgi:hypothetical protein
VTNTNNSGAGSLRQAILDTNNLAGKDTITFAIASSGVQTITLASALPDVTDPVVINGTSEPGFAGKPLVELNGANTGAGANGLVLRAGGSTVKGLVINRFPNDGILVTGLGANIITGDFIGTDPTGKVARANGNNGVEIVRSSNNTVGPKNVSSGNAQEGVAVTGSGAVAAAGNVVKGNKIGTDFTGTAALGNGDCGIVVQDASNNTLGGTAAGAGNLISGNTHQGILFESPGGVPTTGNRVQGNKIGTNAAGNTRLGNIVGVLIELGASGNAVGGTVSGAGNLISGNETGVELVADGNVVQGNKIGTNAAGSAALGNSQGVEIDFNGNTVGGTAAGAGNVISGNSFEGVILEFGASANVVQDNKIGTDVTGTKPVGNGADGIRLRDNDSTNLIAGNTIAFNAFSGVGLGGFGTGNSIRGNALFSNGGLGIDLIDDGVTLNDSGDGDSGPNGLQNFPIITAASSNGSSATIAGSLSSSANKTFTVEFFASAAADPSGFGEGQTFLASATVTTNTRGFVSFNLTFPVTVPQGHFITAAATDPGGNTSEFSKAVVIGPRLAVGSDAGDPPVVMVYDAPTGQLQFSFMAYDVSFRGGVRVAVGDVNGNGVPEVICAPGPGNPEPVKVFDADSGQLLRSFFPFGPAFDKGAFVAVGEFDSDHKDDVVVSEDAGGAPRVKVIRGADGHVIADFLAFEKDFAGGVRLAVADVNGDGHDDIVATAGPGGPPRVRDFDGTDPAHVLRSFLAYAPGFRGGVFVAAGDLDGDGRAEIVTGMGGGGRPLVKVFAGAGGAETARFEVYPASFRGGVRVAVVRDLNRDGGAEIVTGTGPGGGGEVQEFDGRTHDLLEDFVATDPLSSGGVFVAGRR